MRKIWKYKDFMKIQSLKKQHFSSKYIANELNITTNALYKALQRQRQYLIVPNKTSNHLLNIINKDKLIMLANSYKIKTQKKNTLQLIKEVNEHRQKLHMSKLVLNY